MLTRIEFPSLSESNCHECDATCLGDWIVYRCSQCDDYERWYNSQTGKMKTKGLKAHIHHWGLYDMSDMSAPSRAPENLH